MFERTSYPNGSRHRLMGYLTGNMPDAEVKIMKHMHAHAMLQTVLHESILGGA